MKKWEFNDDIPAEEAAAMIRAAERYANAVEKPDVRVIFAILGIERAEAAKDHDRTQNLSQSR